MKDIKYKLFRYWWIIVIIGFILFIPKVKFLENFGTILVIMGLAVYFYKRRVLKTKQRSMDRNASSEKVIIPSEIFIAWTHKQNAFSKLLEDLRSSEQPYSGMSDEDIIGKNSDRWFFEYPIKIVKEVELVPEPTNKYNPEAISVVVPSYGIIGYIPNDDIDAARVLMDIGGDYHLRIQGGKYKQVHNGEVYASSIQVVAHLIIN